MDSKNIFQSKTIWVNFIAVIAMLVQTQTGFIIDPEAQAAMLGVINVILRFVTKSPVTWGNDDEPGIPGGSGTGGIGALGAALLSIALLTSCALNANTYKALDTTKVSAEGIAKIAIDMHKAGTLQDKDYAAVKAIYEQARTANDAVIDAMQLSLKLGQDPRSQASYNAALDESVRLMADLIELAVKLKLITGGQ